MEKGKIISAYETIGEIKDLFNKAEDLFNLIPHEIQHAIHNYHIDNATLRHCIRWGLQAADDIYKDWHTVVSDIPCGV